MFPTLFDKYSQKYTIAEIVLVVLFFKFIIPNNMMNYIFFRQNKKEATT